MRVWRVVVLQVIGVEPSGANSMAMSLAQGRRVTLSRVDAFADGVAVKHVSGHVELQGMLHQSASTGLCQHRAVGRDGHRLVIACALCHRSCRQAADAQYAVVLPRCRLTWWLC